jgi:hypothetical protein
MLSNVEPFGDAIKHKLGGSMFGCCVLRSEVCQSNKSDHDTIEALALTIHM